MYVTIALISVCGIEEGGNAVVAGPRSEADHGDLAVAWGGLMSGGPPVIQLCRALS